MTWWRRTPPTVPLSASAAAVLVLVAAAIPGAGVSPFVIRIAEFLLAGGAAYLLDDAAAPLTGVTPPGVWRRRSPVVLTGAGLLTVTWLGILLVLGWQDALPPVLLATGELVVLCLGRWPRPRSSCAAAIPNRAGRWPP
jgi:hypothetical protein